MHRLPVSCAAAAALLLLPAAAAAQTSVLGVPVVAPAPALTAAPAPQPGAAGVRVHGLSGALRTLVVQALDTLGLAGLEPEAEGHAHRWRPLMGSAEPAVLGSPAPSVLGEPSPSALGDAARSVLGEPAPGALLQAPAAPGVWQLEHAVAYAAAPSPALTVITRVPFARKRNGYLNGYHIGTYPLEGSGRRDRYAPPAGFIEVTPENQELHVSEHFQLRQFLTKDQRDVWPKYLALDLRVIDKLELVLQELEDMGVRADRMHVMSGFRTPQYNGPGEGGRARLSRHTYGDAADVWVDSDGDGYIDDLNGDGRADLADVRVMMRAVDRVEQRHPELAGGAGIYNANSAHGPFIHIDVRGARSRW